MKTPTFLSIVAALSLAAGLQAATVIEYRFDSQTRPDGTYSLFGDSSGNGYDLKYNGLIAAAVGNFPFSNTYPQLAATDSSARNNTTNSVRSGVIQGITGATDWQTNNSFTLEGWVNVYQIVTVSGTPQPGLLWALNGGGGSDPSRFQLRYNADLTVSAWWFSKGISAQNTVLTSTQTISLNQWTHLAYVYDGSLKKLTLYINGAVAASQTGLTTSLPATLNSNSAAGVSLGANYDDFRLSNTALSPEELGYHAPFTPVPEPSTAALLIGIGLFLAYRGRRAATGNR